MKNARQEKILELIERFPLDRQEDLLEKLRESGYHVTQATVSRDIRELNLVKAATGDGTYRYAPSLPHGKPKLPHTPNRFKIIFRESVLSLDYAGNIVMVKCFTGMATAACELFDSMVWSDILGTLSGDDTFIVLTRNEQAAAHLCETLYKFLPKQQW